MLGVFWPSQESFRGWKRKETGKAAYILSISPIAMLTKGPNPLSLEKKEVPLCWGNSGSQISLGFSAGSPLGASVRWIFLGLFRRV